MTLSRDQVAALSRLLDEAQEVPRAERPAWLASLPSEHAPLVATLEQMLAERDGMDTSAPATVSALPPLGLIDIEHSDGTVAHAGDAIGPYRLLREIGRGGMGSVWLAERADGAFQRQLALKLPRLAWGAGLAERMARERDIGALLEHPNIARLYDAGVDERGRPYLALEYIDGQPIDAWCEARGLGIRARLRLFVPVAKAVAYAHGRLVVHRDLKPSNVLVTADGQVHLLDFGIAKLLREGAAPGEEPPGLTQEQGRVLTPSYASPEQITGQPITVQSDVYSLGVLLYELLTGKLPFEPERRTLGAIEEAILQGDAPAASSRVKDRASARALRGDVDAILGKAMQREPQRRYATADALALDIERHLVGETVTARPDSVAYRMRKAMRRHWVGVTATAGVLIAVLTGSGVAVVQAERAARSAERERVVKDFVADIFRLSTHVDQRNAAYRPKSPRELMDGGVRLIEARFAGRPDLQAQVFEVVGRVFSDMGAHTVAADYASKQIEALTLAGADRHEQARALLNMADALQSDRRFAEAEVRARRAAELAKGDRQLMALALVTVADVLAAIGRGDDATRITEEVERLIAADGGAAAPSVVRSMTLFVRARLLDRANRHDLSQPLFERAIDMAIAAEGELSRVAIPQRTSLLRSLANHRKKEAFARHFDLQMAALRKLGAAHEVHAEYLAAMFAALHSDERVDARLQALVRSRAALAASQMPVPDFMIAQVDFWIGSLTANRGDIRDGLALMEKNVDLLWARLADPLSRFYLAAVYGISLVDAGRHEVAAVWLTRRKEARAQHGQHGHPFAVWDHIFIARNLAWDGRLDQASAVLDAAPRFEPLPDTGSEHPQKFTFALIWARAEILVAQGQWRAALDLLAKSDLGERVEPSDRRRYDEIRYEALCGEGRSDEGLRQGEQLLAAEESQDFVAHAPRLARLRAVVGLCAWRRGDRALAQGLAAQARAAFTAQPEVSPYYKAPLVRLERALGLRLPPV